MQTKAHLAALQQTNSPHLNTFFVFMLATQPKLNNHPSSSRSSWYFCVTVLVAQLFGYVFVVKSADYDAFL